MVSAINANSLKVTFNKAVDTEAAKFEVKLNGSTVQFKDATWNAEKTEATLEKKVGKLAAGDYTVTTTGLTDEALTETTKVEAERVENVEIAGDKLVQAVDGKSGTVTLKITNQYDEDITKSIDASDLTVTTNNDTKHSPAFVKADGKVTVTVAGGKTFEEEKIADVQLTVVHKATSKLATKKLTVSSASSLVGLAFGDIQLPKDKTLLTEDLKDITVPYEAVDQYGNTLDLTKFTTDHTVVVSDEDILDPAKVSFGTDANKNTILKVAQFKKAGKVTVTVVGKSSGVSAKVTFDVQEKAGSVYDIQLAETAKTIAAGSTATIELNVTDKYGNKVEPKDYVNKGLNIVSSNPNVVANGGSLKINNTVGNDNYGKLEVPVVGGAKKDTKTVITITDASSGKVYGSVTVTAGEAVAPATIEVNQDKAPATTLVTGAESEVKYIVKDQYGNKVSGNDAGYSVEFELKSGSEDKLDIVAPALSGGKYTVADESNVAAKVQAKAAGDGVLVAKLLKGAEVVDTVEVSYTVVANQADKLTYEIADIPALYQNAKVDADTNGAVSNTELLAAIDAGYAKEIKVSAKDANGQTYTLPSSAIVTATVDAGGKNIIVQKETTSGKWYIVSDVNTEDKDFTAKITVTVNAEDSVKSVTKDVTVSAAAPKASSLSFKNLAATVANASTAKDAKLEYTITGPMSAAKADLTGADVVHAWVQDQFGGYGITPTFTLVGVDGVTGIGADDTVTISGGNVTITDADNSIKATKENAKFRVIATAGDKSGYLTFTWADGIAPTAAATDAVSVNDVDEDNTYSEDDIITLKFSEAVKVSDVIAKLAAETGDLDDSVIAAVDADADGYATTFTVTLKNGSGALSLANDGTENLELAIGDVEDKAGNKNTSKITFNLPDIQ